jgi:superfamily II DNA or RNA helicase
VIRPDGDAHSFCQFTAEAVPQLRALGWQVDVDAAYPFRVAQADELCWYADVKPLAKEGGLPDWFSLELGVEVDGRRIDVLPLIVDLLDEAGEDDDLRALDRRFRSTYALSVGDGTHVALDRARLRALLRVVIELYQGVRSRKGVRVEFPAARAAALASLDAAFAAGKTRIAWNDPSAVLARGRAVTARPTEVAPPKGLQAELRPYQVEGVAFLRHLRTERLGGVLADDMGLGKTLQAIAYLCLEKQEGRLAKPALVVAPTSLAFNWAREAQKFAPGLRLVPVHGPQRRAQWANVPGADVVVTTYPVLIRDDERFAEHEFSTVILDEAQAIKNTRTQIFAAIKTLRAEHRVCLTGTPVENHLGETWALFDFLAPGLLGDEIGFKRFYRQPIEEKGDAERMGALRELVAPHILRRVKRDVAKDLPPKTELYRPVELRGKQRELYESIRVAAHADVRKVIRQKGLAASQITILDALTKLRQVCCDPRLVQLDAARQVHGSAKYEALMEMLEAQLASGHRALVFSQFTSMLALIAEGLKERGTRYVVLTGATQNRSRVVDAFESGEADVFLISLKAGGTGLNLVSADTVIHYDPWWNPAGAGAGHRSRVPHRTAQAGLRPQPVCRRQRRGARHDAAEEEALAPVLAARRRGGDRRHRRARGRAALRAARGLNATESCPRRRGAVERSACASPFSPPSPSSLSLPLLAEPVRPRRPPSRAAAPRPPRAGRSPPARRSRARRRSATRPCVPCPASRSRSRRARRRPSTRVRPSTSAAPVASRSSTRARTSS